MMKLISFAGVVLSNLLVFALIAGAAGVTMAVIVPYRVFIWCCHNARQDAAIAQSKRRR